jgi:hypothetical protein
MGKINKTLVLLALIIVMPCLTLPTVEPATTSPSPSAESTPHQLIPPSTIAPSKNFSVAPLSSLNMKVDLQYGESCGGLIIIKGGSGNDINFRIIDPQGKTYLDFGRISKEKSFQFFTPNRPGNFTLVFDNEFSVFSSKEVDVFSNTYPDNVFEFAAFSINLWVIIFVAISLTVLITFVVWLLKKKRRV